MSELFKREALTRILDAAYDCTTGAEEGDFHILVGVKPAAVLHGVTKNFPKSVNDVSAISFGKPGLFHSLEELNQPICRDAVAAGHQANPIRRRGENLDAVVPTRGGHDAAHYFEKIVPLERTRQIAKGTFAHGSSDVTGCPLLGENNEALVRANAPDLAKQLKIFRAVGLGSRDNQVERS